MASNLSSKFSSVLGVTLVAVLLDMLLVVYVSAHGLMSAGSGISLGGFNFQIIWLPLFGVLFVALAASQDSFARIFPRWLGPGADPMGRLRFLRAVAISLMAFTCLLYVPYLLGSGWFWRHLSEASHLIRQLDGFGNWLENLELPILSMDPIWQYAITEVLASAALIFSMWILARPVRRPKRLK